MTTLCSPLHNVYTPLYVHNLSVYAHNFVSSEQKEDVLPEGMKQSWYPKLALPAAGAHSYILKDNAQAVIFSQ